MAKRFMMPPAPVNLDLIIADHQVRRGYNPLMKRPALVRAALLLIGAVVVLSDAPGAGAEKRAIAPAGIKPIGPYSPGVLAGDFLYVSGQGGRDADGKLPATIEGQARQTLQNVKAIVEAAGLTMEHVVYCQVYLT